MCSSSNDKRMFAKKTTKQAISGRHNEGMWHVEWAVIKNAETW